MQIACHCNWLNYSLEYLWIARDWFTFFRTMVALWRLTRWPIAWQQLRSMFSYSDISQQDELQLGRNPFFLRNVIAPLAHTPPPSSVSWFFILYALVRNSYFFFLLSYFKNKPTSGFVTTSHTQSNLLGMISSYQVMISSLAVHFPSLWMERESMMCLVAMDTSHFS